VKPNWLTIAGSVDPDKRVFSEGASVGKSHSQKPTIEELLEHPALDSSEPSEQFFAIAPGSSCANSPAEPLAA
jgi:hypothetical protein